MSPRFPLCVSLLFLFTACSDSPEESVTGSDVATSDSGTADVRLDSGEDAASDAGEDAASDAGEDAATDAGEDAAADAAEDTSTDTADDVVADAEGDVADDAPADASPDADAGDDATDAGDDTSEDATEDVDVVEPVELATCDGPGGAFVVPNDTTPVDVAWVGGDLVLRGYAADCGPDSDSQELRIRSSCGGEFDLTLSARSPGSTVGVTAIAEGVVDAAGDAVAGGGETANDVPATFTLDLHGEVVAGDEFDLVLDVGCTAGAATNWSLVIDTPSTAPTPRAENGWGLDRAPVVPAFDYGCEVGDVLPNLDSLIDQYGNTDVSLGQFAGDMLVIEIGGMWCAPCRDLAPGLVQLSREVEVDPSFGFTFLALVGDDSSYQTTDEFDLLEWANEIEAGGPVLGGQAALDFEEYCGVELFPTTLIVDPDFVVREVLLGPEVATVEASVSDAWSAFRDESPEWSSTRCEGVSEPGNLCGCVDDRFAPDDDDDTVPNACDECDGLDDRMTFGTPPLPDRCYERIIGPPRPVVRASWAASFAFDPVLNEIRSVGFDSEDIPPEIRVNLTKEFGFGACGITRTATGPIPALETLGSTGVPLIAWELNRDNSTVSHGCDAIDLNPELWPADLSAAINATTWGVTVTNRCGLDGCTGADDPFWDGLEYPTEPTECDLYGESCPRAFVGAAPYFGSVGSVEGPEGQTQAFGVAYPLDEGFRVATDLTLDTFTEWIDILEILAGPPRAGYSIYYDFSPFAPRDVEEAEVAEWITGAP